MKLQVNVIKMLLRSHQFFIYEKVSRVFDFKLREIKLDSALRINILIINK